MKTLAQQMKENKVYHEFTKNETVDYINENKQLLQLRDKDS